ncbi:MAG: serine protease [Chthoniobacteraceae bacterium]|nr:serine protease [Chthoniobacteraceae bacterium]
MEKTLLAMIALLLILGWNQSFKERWDHLVGKPVAEQRMPGHSKALLIVEGKQGGGSAFLCRLDGRPVVISNAHVIGGIPGFKLTSIAGTAFTVQSGAVAVGHDLVKLEVGANPGPDEIFEVMENLDANVKIGDAVSVLGNAEGAKVVRPVEGKVVGIGPNLVEVDAPFVPGNSGSPIIHQATGKVLGVATYLIKRNVSKDASECVTVEPRRFGYRLDHVKTWEPIQWPVFYAQAQQVEKIELLSQDFITLFRHCQKTGAVSGDYKSPAILRAVQLFSNQNVRNLGSSERATLVPKFLGELRFASRADILSFDTVHAYDYFRQKVEEHRLFRDAIYTGLTRAIDGTR